MYRPCVKSSLCIYEIIVLIPLCKQIAALRCHSKTHFKEFKNDFSSASMTFHATFKNGLYALRYQNKLEVINSTSNCFIIV